MNAEELYHYGIARRSGRYPYGSGKRPFQRSPSSKGKRYDPKSEGYEERKKEAIKSGTATEVLKYRGNLTNSELNDALSRIRFERQLSDISKKEKEEYFNKFDHFMNKVKKVNDWGDTSMRTAKNSKEISKILEEFSKSRFEDAYKKK